MPPKIQKLPKIREAWELEQKRGWRDREVGANKRPHQMDRMLQDAGPEVREAMPRKVGQHPQPQCQKGGVEQRRAGKDILQPEGTEWQLEQAVEAHARQDRKQHQELLLLNLAKNQEQLRAPVCI